MYLLEFHYWSDVVMVGVIASFVTACIILYYVIKIYRRDSAEQQEKIDKIFKSATATKEKLKKGISDNQIK